MKKSEYAENNVDAKAIIAAVLDTLEMNAPAFSTATGISYQRIYDLQRGRTKKFNPGVVNMIISAFPQIRKEFLYTGDGPVTDSNVPADLVTNPMSGLEATRLLAKTLRMQSELLEKAERLADKERELHEKEVELLRREYEVKMREERIGMISEKRTATV